MQGKGSIDNREIDQLLNWHVNGLLLFMVSR